MLGIILGLITLMFLAFKGISILWAAPVAASIVALIGGLDLLEAFTEIYMQGFASFIQSWFPVFMLSAIFGKLMEFTGMAKVIAIKLSQLIGKERAILAIIVSCSVLTYGGISMFVVVFAIYPIALSLFKEANISRKILPATIALGSFTFTMTALPGSPQIQNLIPIPYFNTTATAAPIMGIIAAVIIAVSGYLYLRWRQKQLTLKGEVFVDPQSEAVIVQHEKLPNLWLSILPLFIVIVGLNVLRWDIVVVILLGNFLIIGLNLSKVHGIVKTINEGASGAVVAIVNTSAAVGFGAVVRNIPAFESLVDLLTGIPGNPLISLAVAVNILAGATGSASGGLEIALIALGDHFYQLSVTSGISIEAFHRVAALASGSLDALPHNGAIITLLIITEMSHKESYKDIAVATILFPIIATIVVIALATVGIY